MRVKYDKETDILIVRLRDEPVLDSEHIEDLGIVIDYGKEDKVVGFEIFGWSKREERGEWVEFPLVISV